MIGSWPNTGKDGAADMATGGKPPAHSAWTEAELRSMKPGSTAMKDQYDDDGNLVRRDAVVVIDPKAIKGKIGKV